MSAVTWSARAALGGVLVALAGLATSACGVTDESSANRIDFDEFAVTTSSTPVETTVAPTAPTDSSPTPVSPPVTAAPAPFELYYAQGTGLVAVPVDLPAPPSLRDVVDGLAAEPTGMALDEGARTLVAPDLVRSMTLRDHLLTIDLDSSAFALVDPSDQRQLIGQLVLSLAGHPGVGGIDAWLFTLDGRPLRVNRRDGTLSQPGVAVTVDDYSVLLDSTRPNGE